MDMDTKHEKRGKGRPKLGYDVGMIRCPCEVIERWNAYAAAAGLTLAEWIRVKVAPAIDRKESRRAV